MTIIILLYMLASYKAGWGIEWYDWGLFFFVLFTSFVKSFTESFAHTLEPQSRDTPSYFDDLKKDKKEKK